jgi:hypothetical protein
LPHARTTSRQEHRGAAGLSKPRDPL